MSTSTEFHTIRFDGEVYIRAQDVVVWFLNATEGETRTTVEDVAAVAANTFSELMADHTGRDVVEDIGPNVQGPFITRERSQPTEVSGRFRRALAFIRGERRG